MSGYGRFTQRGQSSAGALMNLVMFGLAALIVIKLWSPLYDNYSVKKVIEGLPADASLNGKTPKELFDIVSRRLQVNGSSITESEFKVVRTERAGHVTVNFERRVPVVPHIDLVVHFVHEADLPQMSRE